MHLEARLLLPSDNLSMTSAFAAVDHKSQKVILFLLETEAQTSSPLEATEVIWMPRPSGIQCDELAGIFADHLKNTEGTIWLISHEDIIAYLKKQYKNRIIEALLASGYIVDFSPSHKEELGLQKSNVHPYRKGYQLDYRHACFLPWCNFIVFVYAFHLSVQSCQVLETTIHYLLEC